MKKVTVVIPNFNGKTYLDDCLKSLKKQQFKDFDIIVVDDGSTDGSVSYLKERWPEVNVIALSDNTGFANAVNTGIRESDSPYVYLLNNDCICSETAIGQLVKDMDKDIRLFSVQSKMLAMKEPHNIDDSGDLYSAMGWAFSPGKDKPSTRYNKRAFVTSCCAGAAMYRRSALDETGLFDVDHFCYLEDVDIGYRARLFGYMNMMEPSSVVYHAGSASSGSRYNEFKVKLTAGNNIYLIYKNMTVLQIVLNLPLIIAGILIKHVFYVKKRLGYAHIKGLAEGFSKISKGKHKRLEFTPAMQLRAVTLQLELWINCLKRLCI